MRTVPLPEVTANAVYEILERECGAPAHGRWTFVSEFTSERPTHEWRFQGALGFGGKFYFNLNDDRPMRVGCYREHETSERLAMMARANDALVTLFAQPPQDGGREG